MFLGKEIWNFLDWTLTYYQEKEGWGFLGIRCKLFRLRCKTGKTKTWSFREWDLVNEFMGENWDRVIGSRVHYLSLGLIIWVCSNHLRMGLLILIWVLKTWVWFDELGLEKGTGDWSRKGVLGTWQLCCLKRIYIQNAHVWRCDIFRRRWVRNGSKLILLKTSRKIWAPKGVKTLTLSSVGTI